MNAILALIDDTEKLIELSFEIAGNAEEVLNLGWAAVNGDVVGCLQVAFRVAVPKVLNQLASAPAAIL